MIQMGAQLKRMSTSLSSSTTLLNCIITVWSIQLSLVCPSLSTLSNLSCFSKSVHIVQPVLSLSVYIVLSVQHVQSVQHVLSVHYVPICAPTVTKQLSNHTLLTLTTMAHHKYSPSLSKYESASSTSSDSEDRLCSPAQKTSKRLTKRKQHSSKSDNEKPK